jgi:adenosine deaminase
VAARTNRLKDPASFLHKLRVALDRPGTAQADASRLGFVRIQDRRQRDSMPAVVEHAVPAHVEPQGFMHGLDLAGGEGMHVPQELAARFTPPLRERFRITPNAGKRKSAQNIWQAAYPLYAEWIGHGLTILDNAPLVAPLLPIARALNNGPCAFETPDDQTRGANNVS